MSLRFWRNRRRDELTHVCGCGAEFPTREERAEHMRDECPNKPGIVVPPMLRRYRDVPGARRYDVGDDS